ncbi:MAG: cytidine deaminase [Bacteroidetes bacterium GWC2_33_15]|nr:MAG: cytidine deaminase [Bacteroidetes bacterium GWA2_33_15]OFX49081.1 MAG: cytidine deaminase [Bacteroidetes bacterium GWC2_33_15]OFX64850.1 MAG: cytidine deaminase [Bacteroidetes bacterium GWB2_32_14]OFX68558.1 MAG: cytidine deaminase [Bacteroidetes bacterium GWD2_33_33]HAN17401.1 cytidine deaminase [Bacteroidales bacterium]
MKKREITSVLYEYNSPAELEKVYERLIENAKKAAENAYAPYSKFKVGAAVLLENDEIVIGNNQENAAYPSGLCAERVAIFYANAKYPDKSIKAIAVAAINNNSFVKEPISPCGSCLQVMLESEKKTKSSIKVFLYGQKQTLMAESINQFLPINFNGDLLLK